MADSTRAPLTPAGEPAFFVTTGVAPYPAQPVRDSGESRKGGAVISSDCDVVVVGGGPVGLLLASELCMAGASVLLAERRPEADTSIKAGVLGPLAVEALERRGLGERLAAVEQERFRQAAATAAAAAGLPDPARLPASAVRLGPTNHFAGLEYLEPDRVKGSQRRRMAVNQYALELMLADHARRLGVDFRREHELIGLEQDAEGVTARLATPRGEKVVRASYLAGCDGGHSTVRKLLGIEFEGTGPTLTGRQAVVELADPGALRLGWHRSPEGMLAYGLGVKRVFTVEFDGPPADKDAPVTLEEIQESMRRTSGADVEVLSVKAPARFTDNARQAKEYRRGRVFLAGDAAHVHPPFGAQGLNVGLLDAVNLGWKLAAAVAGRAAQGLLDSYAAERQPAGRRLMHSTRAQTALMRTDEHTSELRELFASLMRYDDVNEHLWNILTGLDERYDLGDPHPLVGTLSPNWNVRLRDACPGKPGPRTNVAELMGSGRGLLLSLTTSPPLGWSSQVDSVAVVPDTSGVDAGGSEAASYADLQALEAMLLRPDGCIAWVGTAGGTTPGRPSLSQALSRWFGDRT
ncbi:FAD-dependent oxidoreductase [Streptomyces huiliensis]|uniref:FAD-dependent oxidoreductase n=1 Tax=Streptomyces huiliensis TaxID=2876027 RepID=UPI001CBBDF2D|nr:FAD-dependent oxidoreductase [Streptomyces huiliensis]MBZ4321569.1 FAD-dependent oxidoreductase [Streptomyces huiliensis]